MDIMSFLNPGATHPKLAAQIGSPLLSALLAKHGAVAPGADAAPASPTVIPGGPLAAAADAPAGAPVTDTGSIVNALGDGGSPMKLDMGGPGGSDGIAAALSANAAKPRTGFLDRIGDFLHSDEGRAALLRSGAATLTGGLGAGIQAGANFVDQRRHERKDDADAAAQAAMGERKFGLEERRADDENAWRLGELDVNAANTAEAARHNRAGERLSQYGITSENKRAVLHETNETGRTKMGLSERQFEHVSPSGDTIASQAGESYRHDHPTPAPVTPDTVVTTETTAPTAPTHHWFSPDDPGAPGRKIIRTEHIRPSQVTPKGPNSGPVSISSDAEFNALPSGAQFKGPDGILRTKP